MIAGIHQMLAAGLDIPEIALDPTEAEKLTEAAEQVSKFYAVSVDPKKAALFNFAIVAGGIYTTRYMAYRVRVRGDRAQRAAEVPAPVLRMPGAPAAPAATVDAAAPRLPSDLWKQDGVIGESGAF